MQIVHRITGALILEIDSLVAANLSGADLIGANLRRANLRDANLSGANLSDANLSDADLRGANLRGADLRGANLYRANLYRANLGGADLSGADLSDANLSDANLRGANLSDANLSKIRDDIYQILDAAPAEVPALIAALKSGEVDGSVYEGKCACLVGTIANARGCNYEELDGIKPNAARPAEIWFYPINEGDTPANNQVCAITVEWCETWLATQASKKGGE